MNMTKICVVASAFAAMTITCALADDYTLTPKDASGTVTINVESGSHTMDDADIAAILASGVTKFAKTGAGTLIAGDIGTFAGEIVLVGGTYQIAAITALGTTAGKTTVADGAMLQLTEGFSLQNEPIEIIGTGVGGKGALYQSALTKGNLTVGNLKLNGNARIQTDVSQITFTTGTFDMQHYELTTYSASGNTTWERNGATNPGTIINEHNQFWVGWSGKFEGGDAEKGWGKIVIGGTTKDSVFSFWSRNMQNTRSDWTIAFRNAKTEHGIIFYQPQTYWYGPIVIEEGAYGKINGYGGNAHLYGPISGPGNGNINSVLWLYGTNTWTGTLSLSQSVYAMNEKSVPEDKLATIGENMNFAARTDALPAGYTAAKLMDIIDLRKDTLKTQIFVDKGQSFEMPGKFTATVTKPIAVSGEGCCRFTGGFENNASMTFQGPSAQIELTSGESDARNAVGGFTFSGAHATMSNFYATATGSLTISGTTSGVADASRLTLEDALWDNPGNNKYLVMANEASARAILELKSGAVLSNGVKTASGANSCAAIYQHAGSRFTAMGGGGHDAMFGAADGAHAYHEVNAGADYTITTFTSIGNANNSVGMLYQKGGTVSGKNWFYLAQAGRGIWYQTGGTCNLACSDSGMRCCCLNYSGINKGADAQLTVTGAGTTNQIGGPIELCERYDSTSTVNLLDGGTLCVNGIIMPRFRKYGVPNTTANYTNQFGYVNFNGGVYRPYWYNGDLFGTATGSTLVDGTTAPNFPTRITVFPKGAIFRVDRHGASWVRASAPIERIPAGGGSITAITLPDDFEKTGFIAPPYVEIKGKGTNATAVAEFDSTSGTVTGVTVTSPGWGYDDTTTVVLSRGGKTTSCTIDASGITRETLTSGGLTMRGVGILQLAATNTYEGATRVEGGTLQANCDWAIPKNTEVILAGGKLNFNGKKAIVSKLTYAVGGGSMQNTGNVTLPDTFNMALSVDDLLAGKSVGFSANTTLTGNTLTLTGDSSRLDPNARYTLVTTTGTFTGRPTLVAPGLDPHWKMWVSGKKVRLSYTRGFAIKIL